MNGRRTYENPSLAPEPIKTTLAAESFRKCSTPVIQLKTMTFGAYLFGPNCEATYELVIGKEGESKQATLV